MFALFASFESLLTARFEFGVTAKSRQQVSPVVIRVAKVAKVAKVAQPLRLSPEASKTRALYKSLEFSVEGE